MVGKGRYRKRWEEGGVTSSLLAVSAGKSGGKKTKEEPFIFSFKSELVKSSPFLDTLL